MENELKLPVSQTKSSPTELIISESTKIAKSIREWDIPKPAGAGAEKRASNERQNSE